MKQEDICCANCINNPKETGCEIDEECLHTHGFYIIKRGRYYYYYNNFMSKKKGEDSMEYKATGKSLQVKDIVNSREPSDQEKGRFLNNMKKEFGLNYGDLIPITHTFISYAQKNECFIRWLLREKYVIKVKKSFKPFTMSLDINSLEELLGLWHRLNTSGGTFQNYIENHTRGPDYPKGDVDKQICSTHSLWAAVDEIRRKKADEI